MRPRLRQLLEHIDWFEATIAALDDRVADLTAPWSELISRLQTIPGVGRRTAEVIIAETGGDTTLWPTAGHLASWAGISPEHHESDGKRRSGRTTTGDVWLAAALIDAAWSAVRTNDTYLAAKFWRLAGPEPPEPQEEGRRRGGSQDPDRGVSHHGHPR